MFGRGGNAGYGILLHGRRRGRFDQKTSPRQANRSCPEPIEFGTVPEISSRFASLGIDKWIEQQLHPERSQKNPHSSQLKLAGKA